jgi:hypothetical protein
MSVPRAAVRFFSVSKASPSLSLGPSRSYVSMSLKNLRFPKTPKTTSNFQPILRRGYASGGAAKGGLKIWPFVFILAAGTGSYILMVKQRAGEWPCLIE